MSIVVMPLSEPNESRFLLDPPLALHVVIASECIGSVVACSATSVRSVLLLAVSAMGARVDRDRGNSLIPSSVSLAAGRISHRTALLHSHCHRSATALQPLAD